MTEAKAYIELRLITLQHSLDACLENYCIANPKTDALSLRRRKEISLALKWEDQITFSGEPRVGEMLTRVRML